jgi:hypothetical protein
LKAEAEAPGVGLAPLLLWAALASMAWSFCSLGLRPVVRFGALGGRLLMARFSHGPARRGSVSSEGFGVLPGDGHVEDVEELSGAAVGDLAGGDALEDFAEQGPGGGGIGEIGREGLGVRDQRAGLVEAAEGLAAQGGSAAAVAVDQCVPAELDDFAGWHGYPPSPRGFGLNDSAG